MNKFQQKRLYLVTALVLGIAIAATFIFYALKQNMNVFLTPKQIASANLPAHYHFRLGGMVKNHTVVRDKNSLNVTFVVTDLKQDLTVQYVGVLPDLFREGKGVIAEGNINDQGVFVATQILAKHDENYMPKNVYQSIREEADKGQAEQGRGNSG